MKWGRLLIGHWAVLASLSQWGMGNLLGCSKVLSAVKKVISKYEWKIIRRADCGRSTMNEIQSNYPYPIAASYQNRSPDNMHRDRRALRLSTNQSNNLTTNWACQCDSYGSFCAVHRSNVVHLSQSKVWTLQSSMSVNQSNGLWTNPVCVWRSQKYRHMALTSKSCVDIIISMRIIWDTRGLKSITINTMIIPSQKCHTPQ